MNVLTFDIEDWYNHDDYSHDLQWDKFEVRIYEGVDKILSALDEQKQKATFFCLGWIAEHHPNIIVRITAAGHHLGCHSYQHELASGMTRQEFRNDTYRAKCLIEDVAGQPVDAFRVPSFSVTKTNTWVFDVLTELGFKYDSSVFLSKHEFGGFPCLEVDGPFVITGPKGALKEFPINMAEICGRRIAFSGGGYFRVMPYVLLNCWMRSSYVMAYFHPSDFDPGQPQMKHLPLIRQFKNRVALRGNYGKFKRFIHDFDFVDLRQADSLIDWHGTKELNIEGL